MGEGQRDLIERIKHLSMILSTMKKPTTEQLHELFRLISLLSTEKEPGEIDIYNRGIHG